MLEMIYNIKDFNEIIFKGFDIKLPDETINIISDLSLQVGSPTYIKTPIFNKKENSSTQIASPSSNDGFTNLNSKKKRYKGAVELNNDDWETLRNYQPTKIEKKRGVEADIDNIRSFLNKMTDKNYNEVKKNILEILSNVKEENLENETDIISQMGENIFNIASNNRFYSKIYADLYSELIHAYEPMKTIFETSFNKFLDLFHNIEFVDSVIDYDRFCVINKNNEKRKALSCFFINLMVNGIVEKKQIIGLLQELLNKFDEYIQTENKINEVNEISENIVLLFKKEHFVSADYEELKIKDVSILKYIEFIANSKSKNFKSLSTKTIFKFMDIVDM